MRVSSAQICRRGGRSGNQDRSAFRQESDAGVWVLADGLGGHLGGEVAAQLAVDAVIDRWHPALPPTRQSLAELIAAAHEAILLRQHENPRLASMRTTLVVLMASGERLIWGYVGDSRLYHFRDVALLYRTLDHSVPQALVDAGEILAHEVRGHEDRNMLLRAVGNADGLRPSVADEPVRMAAGDAVLLCSDGFWEYVTETEMAVDLAKSDTPAAWLDKMEIRLLLRARRNHDNYTAVAIMVDQ